MTLSLISPSRNNLKYLRWSYESVRKNCSPDVEYCVAVDFSDDGTEEWCKEIAAKDSNFKYIVRDQHKRWGHTIWYDILIEEVATGDIVMIWHADMYATPDMDKKIIEAFELSLDEPAPVISLTRVEPPLHPPGAEKLTTDFGLEPEEFDEERFLKYAVSMEIAHKGTRKTGIFAPWAIRREDFLAIGGHDPLFAPQSREDSDIFNRFVLAGHETIQLFDVFVYHMTCRGSRFAGLNLNAEMKRGEGFVRQTSEEWIKHNRRSERNFIRKWGHMVKTDAELKPIIPAKYDIAIYVSNCNINILTAIEPWCSKVIFSNLTLKDNYLMLEQPNTKFDLSKRVLDYHVLADAPDFDILVSFDGNQLTNESFKIITQLPEILAQTNDTGEFMLDIFKIQIFKLKTYEKSLVNLSRQEKDEAIKAYLENDNLP